MRRHDPDGAARRGTAQRRPLPERDRRRGRRGGRGRSELTYPYWPHAGWEISRGVETLGLVNTLGRWYLVAYYLDGNDWRVFRVDRMSDLATTRTPTGARKPPADDLDAYVTARLGQGYQQVSTVVRIHAPLRQAEPWIKPACGHLTPTPPHTSTLPAAPAA